MKSVATLAWLTLAPQVFAADPSAIKSAEFIYTAAPFPSCHASTIVETKAGLVAAWFGGSDEGKNDVGIWLARHSNNKWSAPIEVATGAQADGSRLPCWNPVLFQPKTGPLLLFYKVGPSPSKWWGMIRTSADNGQTWSEAQRLSDNILGPVKNKPVQLTDGTIVSGSSTEGLKMGPAWQVHFERSADNGLSWQRITVPSADNGPAAIQPSILVHGDGRLQAIGRSKAGNIFTTISRDRGQTWEALTLSQLPNPNAGTDALTMKDGRHVLVYNHTTKGRSPLNIAVSKDGLKWQAALVLENEPGEYSYPAVIQSADGLLHITYTWKRQRIRHVVVDPARFALVPITDGAWPLR